MMNFIVAVIQKWQRYSRYYEDAPVVEEPRTAIVPTNHTAAQRLLMLPRELSWGECISRGIGALGRAFHEGKWVPVIRYHKLSDDDEALLAEKVLPWLEEQLTPTGSSQRISPSQARFLIGDENMTKVYDGEAILVEPEGCKVTCDVKDVKRPVWLNGYAYGGVDVSNAVARLMEAEVY